MSRTLGRVALLLSMLLLLPMLVMRAQPNENSALLSAIRPPEDCPAPCFMGIRPGTTWNDAVALLEQSRWVESPRDDNAYLYAGWGWQWSAAAPSWINKTGRSLMLVRDMLVNMVVVETTIPWGEFRLAFGEPDQYRLVTSPYRLPAGSDYGYRHVGWYADWGMLVVADGFCWHDSSTIYDWPVVLQFRTHSPITAPPPPPIMTNCR